jgi:hypothetical protein
MLPVTVSTFASREPGDGHSGGDIIMELAVARVTSLGLFHTVE